MSPESTVTVSEIRHLFHDAGLPFPPLPAAWLAGIQRPAPWVYTTRSLHPGPSDVLYYTREIEEWDVEDYVVLAHSGHGAKGYYLHVFAVHGPLALFLQLDWGGPWRSGPPAAMKIARVFAEADILLQALAEQADDSRITPERRLLVLVSDLHGSGWRLRGDVGPPLEKLLQARHGIETLREASRTVREGDTL